MKIIATTQYGYIIEASCDDVNKITGGYGSANSYGHPIFPIGTEINVHKLYNYLGTIYSNEQKRKAIAEQLRAAATVIETAPSPLTLPAITEEN